MRDQRPLSQLIVVALLGAMLATALPSIAAQVGDPLGLGESNTVDSRTRLVGDVSSSNLQIINQGAGTALDLRVGPGEPPLRVNRSRKVPKLNADRVDGKDAIDFLAVDGTAVNADRVDGLDASSLIRAASARTGDVNESRAFLNDTLTQANLLSVEITAPVDGLILVFGGVDATVFGTHVEGDTFQCAIKVASLLVSGTVRTSQPAKASPSGGHTQAGEEDCTTSGAIEARAGVTYPIAFHILGRQTAGPPSSKVFFQDASLQALFVPFDGAGVPFDFS